MPSLVGLTTCWLVHDFSLFGADGVAKVSFIYARNVYEVTKAYSKYVRVSTSYKNINNKKTTIIRSDLTMLMSQQPTITWVLYTEIWVIKRKRKSALILH